VSADLLLDNSALARLEHRCLGSVRAGEILDRINARGVAVCLPLLLEAGYSARDEEDHNDQLDGLLAMPRLTLDLRTEDRALDAQRQLARTGHHRLSPMDLMTAALADRHHLGILHYDAHFDLIAERTDLEFDSVWLAPRGSL
jgi:predicted nucleic acid-binding protein